nr:immunoglobulin light chain junction region [Macaca mulatta]
YQVYDSSANVLF